MLRQISLILVAFAIPAITGYLLRHRPDLALLAFLLGSGAFAGFIAHLILGYLPRWRPYFWTLIKFYGLTVTCLLLYVATTLFFWSRDERMAEKYVETVAPRLEDYSAKHGEYYPESLSEIPGLPPPPAGLTYASGDDKTYDFHYFRMHYYSGTDQWFVGD
jgi:hypothetical protein